MDRRLFTATLLGVPAALTAASKPAWGKPLSVQLYTLRNTLPKDPEGVIKSLAQIGYREAEVLENHIDQIVPMLRANGMTAPSGHFMLKPGAAWEADVEKAKKHGLKYVVMPYVMPNARGGPDVYRKLADDMNAAGEVCAKAGIQYCYHNHSFEFEGKQGERPWDILMDRWDKKLVHLELDLFWISVAGMVPSEFVRQHAGRVPLVHLKDKAFGTPVQFHEKVAPYAFREVGTGMLEFPVILRACEAAGVKHYVVEQDQTTGDPLDSLRLSYNNLRAMKVKK
jgi:sugar phosphate isomerase/epimerase